MREDMHTPTVDAARCWQAMHAPDLTDDPPRPQDCGPMVADREPGPFADAFVASVAKVRALGVVA